MKSGNEKRKRIFDRYPYRGRIPFVTTDPQTDDSEEESKYRWSLLDYARPTALLCRYRCAYCDRDMSSSFANFLSGQIEHVVPYCSVKNLGYDMRWVANDSNIILACSSCNTMVSNPKSVSEYLEAQKPPDFPIDFLRKNFNRPEFMLNSGRFEEFMIQRDMVYDLKLAHIARSRAKKLKEFKRLLSGTPSGSGAAVQKWNIGSKTGNHCVYCGRDLSTDIDSWLLSQIEHVVPRIAIREFSYPEYLVESNRNLRLACGICNNFAGDQRIIILLSSIGPLKCELDFDDVFEDVLETKRNIVREKRRRYRSFFRRYVLR